MPESTTIPASEMSPDAIRTATNTMWESIQDYTEEGVFEYGLTRSEVSWCETHQTFEFMFSVNGNACGYADITSADDLFYHLIAVIYTDTMVHALADKMVQSDLGRALASVSRAQRNNYN